MNSLKVFLLTFVLLFAFGVVAAQETMDVEEIIALDEDVEAADLDISEPKLLPDNPFYFLKNWGREIQAAFTFNRVKKTELRERFANEKLIELKKIVERKENAEVVKRAIENYQKEISKVKVTAERIKEKAQESPQVEKFLNKYVQQQVLHRQLLDKLETQVPPEAFEKIAEAKERHLEKFSEVMVKLEDKPEKIGERLENNLKEIRGSEFKDFKNLEVLKELEEKVPEAAKEAIQQVQTNSLIRLKEKVEQMSAEKLEKFQTYTERIAGEKEKQLEVLESLRIELKEKPAIKEMLIQSRERVLEKVQERVQERTMEKNCPEIEKPAYSFCKEGRTVIKKDEKGCIISFDCIMPAEVEVAPSPEKPQVCITLWNPVCGENGKTYSNECFAKVAGVDIGYKGVCKEEPVIEKVAPKIQQRLK